MDIKAYSLERASNQKHLGYSTQTLTSNSPAQPKLGARRLFAESKHLSHRTNRFSEHLDIR